MAKERQKAKHAEQAAQRAAAQRKRQRTALLWRGAGLLILLGILGAFAYRFYADRQMTSAVTTGTYAAGLHLAGPISYKEQPPIGGAHNVVWQNCGVYTTPLHNEHAVHSMEHGAVWITYRPDLPADQVAQLTALADDDFMLLSPYPGLPSPVVASAWNHQITLDSASDPRLPRFIANYKNNPSTTPEFGASCFGGTTEDATADSLKAGAGAIGR